MARPKSKSPRTSVANIRFTESERVELENTAKRLGFVTVSAYIRYLHNTVHRTAEETDEVREMLVPVPKVIKRTPFGQIMHGDSLGLLHKGLQPKSVDLIMTSPPFGLVRQKTYGNEEADRYLDWYRPFAEGFRRVIKESGSIVIDIGGSWKRGTPTRSLYHFELLVMLCKEYGFHLCQEHYWWNPARLPSPAEWVNIRRVRVKDAVNCIWWLSPTPWPKANNRRVLAPYSDSMRELFRNGYVAKLRPSGHDISEKFDKDNGGAIPPNLLASANTESNGRYQDYCRERNLPIHPARYPSTIPEYFIRFLTDSGDLVVDPFAGSCVTGEVCERLQRQWICCELDLQYLDGGLARFPKEGHHDPSPATAASRAKSPYKIFPPGSLYVDESEAPLINDGGRRRPKLGRLLKPEVGHVNGKSSSTLEKATQSAANDAVDLTFVLDRF